MLIKSCVVLPSTVNQFNFEGGKMMNFPPFFKKSCVSFSTISYASIFCGCFLHPTRWGYEPRTCTIDL